MCNQNENLIECETHGICRVAYVCNHLLHGSKNGWLQDNNIFGPQGYKFAWCNDCEEVWVAHNEDINDPEVQEFMTIRMVCEHCFEFIKTNLCDVKQPTVF